MQPLISLKRETSFTEYASILANWIIKEIYTRVLVNAILINRKTILSIAVSIWHTRREAVNIAVQRDKMACS